MQCERLIKLTKNWFVSVRDETMAPARMISFMENHVDECPACQNDPDIHDEIAKITEIILPESKIPKAVRMQNEAAEKAAEEEQQNAEDSSEVEDEENEEVEEVEEEDVYDDDDDDFAEEPDLVDK